MARPLPAAASASTCVGQASANFILARQPIHVVLKAENPQGANQDAETNGQRSALQVHERVAGDPHPLGHLDLRDMPPQPGRADPGSRERAKRA